MSLNMGVGRAASLSLAIEEAAARGARPDPERLTALRGAGPRG